ncbi:MAG: indolepyruvate ferredoxin oxidoreductase subunit alpha [Proteobacteria bacterium]|nr:indolepyruvate ferredoxin oxidoreductase subunit alpha [Pseudomonadota bacterium]MBU1743184.1 indolepyruvate ferredoxin oxidoreductase subunit alpha [Pseudomonadota bacterium]
MNSVYAYQAGETVLLQGNQALARGALEAGIRVAAAYPGNPSSEILENLAQAAPESGMYVEWSTNEKVALEVAAAASYSGLRAMASMKQNGVNVCLDTLGNLTLSGVKAGLVLVFAQDPSGISSTNEQDVRWVAKMLDLPLFEPGDPQECLRAIQDAVALSERIGNVCLVSSVSRLSHSRAGVKVGALPSELPRAHFDTKATYVTFPVVARHQAAKDKLERARRLAERTSLNRYVGPEMPDVVLVTAGAGRPFCREAIRRLGVEDRAGVLKLGLTWPLPRDLILSTAARTDHLILIEEIDPFVEEGVKALLAQAGAAPGTLTIWGKDSGHVPAVGELDPDLVATALARALDLTPPGRDPAYVERARQLAAELTVPRDFGFCPGCPHRASFWAIKNVLAVDDREGFVSGDIGCYTMGAMPTGYQVVRSVHAMGSGVGMSSGLGKLDQFGMTQPVVSVVGDSTFFHAAVPALINAVWNRSRFVLVILDNSATAMTGFQPHPGTGETAAFGPGVTIAPEDICRALGAEVVIVDPYDLAATEAALYQALQSEGFTAMVLRRTCALVQGRQGGFPYQMSVDPEACLGEACGCNRFCTRVFRCPGLIWDAEAGKATIDEVICVGCGVCARICPANAIVAQERDS